MASLRATTPSSEYHGPSLDLNFPWMTKSTVSPPVPQSVSPPHHMVPNTYGLNYSPESSTHSYIQYPFNTTYVMDSPQAAIANNTYTLQSSSSKFSSPMSTSGHSSSGYSSNSPSTSISSDLDSTTTPPPPAKKQKYAKPTKSDRPATSYLEMIAKALLSSPNHRMILADIYAYIMQHYPYYQKTDLPWKNAVRHNLSVNAGFMKAEHSNSGRGYFWAIHPGCVEMFSKGDFRRTHARRMVQRTNKNGKTAKITSSDVKDSLSSMSTPTRTSTPVHQPIAASSTFTIPSMKQEYSSGLTVSANPTRDSSPASVYYMTSTPTENRPSMNYNNYFYTNYLTEQIYSRIATPSHPANGSILTPNYYASSPMSYPYTPTMVNFPNHISSHFYSNASPVMSRAEYKRPLH